jgi:hypothetical protein
MKAVQVFQELHHTYLLNTRKLFQNRFAQDLLRLQRQFVGSK